MCVGGGETEGPCSPGARHVGASMFHQGRTGATCSLQAEGQIRFLKSRSVIGLIMFKPGKKEGGKERKEAVRAFRGAVLKNDDCLITCDTSHSLSLSHFPHRAHKVRGS